MSTFLSRIRERSRRQVAKRAKRAAAVSGAPVEPGPLSPLGIEPAQADAIREAITAVPAAPLAEEPLPATLAAQEPEQAAEPAPLAPETTATEPDPVSEPDPEQVAEPPEDIGHIVAHVEFTSSNIREAVLRSDGVLAVEFANGSTYHYANFTIEQLVEWQDAKSAGSWFHHNVKTKPDRHPVLQVPQAE